MLGLFSLALGVSLALVGPAVAIVPPGMTEELPVPLDGTSWPAAITRSSDGSMWFTEEGAGVIGRIAPSGLITGEFPIPNAVQPPSPELYFRAEYDRAVPGIAAGLKGEMWFTDHGIEDWGYTQGFVGKVTPSGVIAEFPLPSTQEVVHHPNSIALGADENMWFTDGESTGEQPVSLPGSIGRITPAGAITEFPLTPPYHSPEVIALGSDGNMWFTDEETTTRGEVQAIGRISSAGTIMEYPLPSVLSFPPGSIIPRGIVLGSDGDMWFTEYAANAIGRITPAGVLSEFKVPSVYGQIMSGSDGNIWFAEGYGSNAFGRMEPQGEVTTFAPISTDGGTADMITAGVDGAIWFTEVGASGIERGIEVVHIGRYVIPLAPVSTAAPLISGEASVGHVLTVSTGSWSNFPSSFGYLWQICNVSGAHCEGLNGEVGSTEALTVDDVGHTLRAVVSAANAGGSATVMSGPSPVIDAVTPPSPSVLERSSPDIGATMTWSFGWSRTYTIVESFAVHGLPSTDDLSITVTCRGRGCPFKHKHLDPGSRICHGHRCTAALPIASRGNVDLIKLFKARRLRVGTHISVSVVRPGWIGKSFMFTVRDNRTPHVHLACLAPGSATQVTKC